MINQVHHGRGDNVIGDKTIITSSEKEESTTLWRIIVKIGILVGIVYSLVGILEAVNGMSTFYKSNEANMNIIQTHSGSGDNVGGNKYVLNEKPERHVDDNLRTQITKEMPVGSTVDIHYLINDQEAFNFAAEIKSYLEQNGYKVNELSASMYQPPFIGQRWGNKNDYPDVDFSIQIGSSN